ncbi:MAG: alpha/beta hydrolase [Aquabacterium sp.]|jgi:pimeloyl-ACP methyl ester carboxylesterase|uniref:alpha/beta fold hydrolase n=1 Tax=Aquabacterium sp. TaxID=1872578 RepID=UPI002A36BDCD|nr:alpha/beta hydrolase [Aquabacterium sp.]MDX9842689.1 alpha/beta hydrolase [Aquabacterium sp.]
MSTWILLRGLTREQAHWGDFPDLLRQALPSHTRILTPDLPGNGALWQSRSPCAVPDMVDHVRQALQEAGHTPPYHVLAMSLGAMVTVDWALRYPEELAAAILLSTSLRPFNPFWQRLRPRQYGRMLRLLSCRATNLEWEQAILAMTSCHAADPQATVARWVAARLAHPVSVGNAMRQLVAAARYRAPHNQPSVPMLLLNGQGDQLVHPACSQALAQAWQLPLITHPTAGHDLPLDAGPWVVSQVQAWLAPRHP